jgi:hypothetical protein
VGKPKVLHRVVDLVTPGLARKLREGGEGEVVLGGVEGDVGVGIERDSVGALEEAFPGGDTVEAVIWRTEMSERSVSVSGWDGRGRGKRSGRTKSDPGTLVRAEASDLSDKIVGFGIPGFDRSSPDRAEDLDVKTGQS